MDGSSMPKCGSAMATSSSIPNGPSTLPARLRSAAGTLSRFTSVCRKTSTPIARRRAAGAEILEEPVDHFYGERQYRARDPEGHIWTFTQTMRVVPKEEAERLSGLRIEGWHR
ncbi:VOC family protein [Mesorhizobium sp. WSM4884]|uniref:VOC family protein n=1 Tax=Mesorhizobium sp. WSM4884 TaxID=3038542 RepID=UPI0032421ECB